MPFFGKRGGAGSRSHELREEKKKEGHNAEDIHHRCCIGKKDSDRWPREKAFLLSAVQTFNPRKKRRKERGEGVFSLWAHIEARPDRQHRRSTSAPKISAIGGERKGGDFPLSPWGYQCR